jgi:phospholipid transport system substrate-binding protein
MNARRLGLDRGLAWVLSALALIFALTASAQATAADDATAYVQKVADEATAIINNNSTSDAAKREALSKMIDTHLDLDKIAKFTLGKYARVATDAEEAQYVPLLKQYVINFYVNNLVKYHDVKFKIVRAIDKGKQGVVVISSIAAGSDQPKEADWRVVNGPSGLSIFDANIEGLWVALNLQSTLVPYMDEHGGKVSAAIERLRQQVNSAPAG